MFDDYILYLVETLLTEERAAELLRRLKDAEMVEEDDEEGELVLPDPTGVQYCSSLPETSMHSSEGLEMRQSVIRHEGGYQDAMAADCRL